MKIAELKRTYKKYGAGRMISLLESALAPSEGKHRLRAEEFSIRELWEGLVGPVSQTLGDGGSGFVMLREDAVDSMAFSDIIGVLLASKVIEGYNTPGYIGDQLVTRVPSKRKEERYAGFTEMGGPREVPEAMPYEETGFQDKYAVSEATKKGRLLNITEEAILFDQTGQLLMRAAGLGEKARLDKEIVILQGIVDTAGTVYSPQGVAEAIYRLVATATSWTINQLGGNALVDWTDIDNIMQVFAAMTDSRGNQIVIVPKILLTPYSLAAVANRILKATQIRTAVGVTETISGNPITGLAPLSSPLLDNDSITNYYLGDFAKQFVWQEIWPLQVARKKLESEAHVRDIIVSYKVRYFGGIAAIDDKYVVRGTL